MEYPNYYYDSYNSNPQQNPKPPKRGIGGYVVTAIVFTLVGALLSAILLPKLNIVYTDTNLKPHDTPYFQEFLPTPEATPAPEQSTRPDTGIASDPSVTPIPPAGKLPVFDGVAPQITDNANPILDIVDQISESVVGIINYGYSEEYLRDLEFGSGSGFVISSEGYILTNAHVVDGATKLGVMFVDGEECEAQLVGFDNSSDVAVIKVDKKGLKAVKLGDSDSARVGEFVIAIGDPTGRELAGTTTFGIISATARSVNIDGVTNDYIQTDAAVNPGNSGGPLINMNGEVIGMVSAKTVTASYDEYGNAIGAEGIGFALPIDQAMRVASTLILEGRVLRPGIGISVLTWSEMYAEKYDTPVGILISTVTKAGPGHKAGLKPNDIIVEVNGTAGLSQEEFVAFIKGMLVGDKLTLKYWRAGEYYETELVLADLNSLGSQTVGGEADYNFYGD